MRIPLITTSLTRSAAASILLLGLLSGCGGGSLPGGAGRFATPLPPESISFDDLPEKVKTLARKKLAEGTIREVTRNVRTSDGKYYYAIMYSDPSKDLKTVHYWHDGSLLSEPADSMS